MRNPREPSRIFGDPQESSETLRNPRNPRKPSATLGNPQGPSQWRLVVDPPVVASDRPVVDDPPIVVVACDRLVVEPSMVASDRLVAECTLPTTTSSLLLRLLRLFSVPSLPTRPLADQVRAATAPKVQYYYTAPNADAAPRAAAELAAQIGGERGCEPRGVVVPNW